MGIGLGAPAVNSLLLGARHRVPVQVGVDRGVPLSAGGGGGELGGGLAGEADTQSGGRLAARSGSWRAAAGPW
ncbi:hypothetical protein ACFVFS_14290 [Kitasatospora sp. NPDC057692]|uniref:hypothetical protein n=1 Tax=Kitasatospora sp. NPDC057692 TaxID=3346215 RepID=UPI003675392C